MQKSTLAVLSYIFGFISGIILLYIEKENEFVRKSAAQSIVISFATIILCWLIKLIPFFGGILSSCIGFAYFLLWVTLIIKASQNIYYRLPIISDLSEKYVLNWFK